MGTTSTCEIDPTLVEKLKQFRFQKFSSKNAAFVLKIDKKTLKIEEEEVFDSISLEDLVEELPENTPRYIILSYELKHSDGRTNYPLLFIYWSPSTAKAELHMLYTSAKGDLQKEIDVMRDFEIREPETLSDEYLTSQLK
ncbi:uncharacterized protein BX664DRAFT_324461 [Halteromyces radiatus]|uniref:uncharacterized protein n=1 Tax=Halteromyces radiatus TaxID=101107 RepID=UPI0022210BE0|nr:uncharacterized protein BX664DRAFT_324461 [Halteromyces radiatus]KAI8096627.1 hypothetical protein BX664DRAFT_324461 [Halteromyces radiatus]